jgi:hypothetical protein
MRPANGCETATVKTRRHKANNLHGGSASKKIIHDENALPRLMQLEI